ncbi:ATP-binding protein [Streptomyces sp. 7-21]|jgi:anti-sigma regulatory factor (Ser/Thr protein kinase)|uniref:ATP-binding protein n=1 Tax=Streptomyces sp. 7-21 TaxID=2802283 RepID=UPI0035A975C6
MLVTRTSLVNRYARHWVLTARAEDIARWRCVVARSLQRQQIATEGVELACLGVSELLTNVARHVADRRCRLAISCTAASVLLSVFDRSAELPKVACPDWDAEQGRGLWLLREMAGREHLGARPAAAPWRKEVWLRCVLRSDGSTKNVAESR